MKYGWNYIFEPTPKNVSKWLLAIRAIFGAVQAAAIMQHASARTQLVILAVGALLHELGTMVGDVPNEPPKPV